MLGEFTFASLLLKNTLPTYMVNYQRQCGPGRHRRWPWSSWSLTSLLLWFVVRLLRRRGIDATLSGVVG